MKNITVTGVDSLHEFTDDIYEILNECKLQRESEEFMVIDIEPERTSSNKIGRNALCPCESGEKYKDCCKGY